MGGGVISTRRPLFQNSFWGDPFCGYVVDGGGVISTRRPLQTHCEEIPSVVALSMEGSVISTHHPL
jgi:hypothetical protein